MRVRVLTRPMGPIAGVVLEDFRIGGVYELRIDVACVFLSEGWAELVGEDDTALVGRALPNEPAAAIRPVVLVVDDDADVRVQTELLLATHGYEVLTAPHGLAAIERLREQCPDLIVLDLNMPVMDGWQFRTAQRFLTERNLASVPVLLLTGEDDAPNQASRLEAIGVIRKPIDPDDLLAAVSAAVASQGSAPDGIGPAWSRRRSRMA